MDYQNYRIRSFDDDAPEEEGQLQVRSGAGSFDTPHHEGAESGAGFEEETPHQEPTAGVTDFASIKFQRENTLLTNAERYAESIREEAELYVRQLQREIEALNEQADRRYEEARTVKEEAEAEAERRIKEADDRVQEIRAQGHREGYEAGMQEGLRKRYEEAGAYLASIEEIFGDLSQYQKQVRYFMEKDGVRLAVLMAKKILQQELKVNKNVIWKLLAATLSRMEGTGQFRIWLNPDDFKFATAARPTLEKYTNEDQTLSFRARPELPPGNAMIETDREVIDLTLASQFRHLDQMLFQSLAESEARAMNLAPEVSTAPEPVASTPATDASPPPPASEPVPDSAATGTESQEGSIDPMRAVEQAAQALGTVEGEINITVSEITPKDEAASLAGQGQSPAGEGTADSAADSTPEAVPHE